MTQNKQVCTKINDNDNIIINKNTISYFFLGLLIVGSLVLIYSGAFRYSSLTRTP